MFKKINQKKKQRRGATTVEMAIVLPVFFIILFGLVETSRIYFAANSAEVALMKSARTLSLPNATIAGGEAAAIDYLTTLGFDPQKVDIAITPDAGTVDVEIAIDMQPFPYEIRRELTRRLE